MSTQTFRTFRTFLGEKCRIGVAEAADVILTRISRGFKTTTIVLPPRYGKSNLMRSVAIEAMELGLVGAVVCLVPWVVLAKQLNKKSAVDKMEKLHGMDEAPVRPKASGYDILSGKINPRFYEAKPQRAWWTMTMAQAQQESTRSILTDAATKFKEDMDRPLLVFIDEGHLTSSGENGWGELARELTLAGAHLVLLTGTPERSDNVAPYGFQTVELDREDEERWLRAAVQPDVGSGLVAMDKVLQQKVKNKLIPDYKVDLKQAWDHNILAGLYARYFTFKGDGEVVHDQSITSGKRALAQAVRDPDVIGKAVDLMIEQISLFRRNPEGHDIAAIVFVGNDRNDDDSIAVDDKKDYECRQVQRIIRERWKHHFSYAADVRIATMGEDNGSKAQSIISEFVGDDDTAGIGDVLIVKQMGGVGLDAPRIKVAVDLSTIRTPSNATQRWLRVATKYKNIANGIVILPADPNTQALWNVIVNEQGGGQVTVSAQAIIDSKLVQMTEGEDKTKIVISDAARYGAIDRDGRYVDVDEDINVEAVLAADPSLAILLTRSKIADLIEIGLIKVPVHEHRPQKVEMLDIQGMVEDRVATINKNCKKMANRMAKYSDAPSSDEWIAAFRQIMIQAKNFGQIIGELKTCRDIDKLDATIQYLERKLRSE